MREWKRYISGRIENAGRAVDPDVVEELAQHAEAAFQSARAEGLEAEEASVRVDALVEGWVSDSGALHRRSRRPPAIELAPSSGSWWAGLGQEARYALRLFRRQPRFALLVAGTMALGIAATTVLFSVTYGVLMKPLPWPDADRIVTLSETRGGHKPRFGTFSNAALLAWRDDPATVEHLAAWSTRTVTLAGQGDPERIRTVSATSSLFPVLNARPLVGSFFTSADEGAGGVVVLSESLWRQRFGADPSAVGRSVQIDGKSHRILGVLPADASFPNAEIRAWVPLRVEASRSGFLSVFDAVARLRPGVTAAQAAAEGTARGRSLPGSANLSMVVNAIFGGDGEIEVHATPLHDAMTADVRRPLLILLSAVLLLFVTAVANVAGLQLAHATSRTREMGIRAALGAGLSRVTRQLLVESLLIGIAGGVAGVALAAFAHGALPALLPADFPRLGDLSFDRAAASFAAVLSIVSACLVGLLPAIRLRHLNVAETLLEDGQAPAGARGRTRVARVRLAIMAGQVAIACILLIGASLLGRSFHALLTADRGFDPTHVLTARLQMPAFAYPAERRAEITAGVIERLRRMPGVTAVALSDGSPLTAGGGTSFMMDDQKVQASFRTVTPGYFAAMGIRIVEGRAFTDEDVSASRPVFIVNRAFARQYLANEANGRRVRAWVRPGTPDAANGADPRSWWEVIGVVDDVRGGSAREAAEPEVYQYRDPRDARFPTAPSLLVRTAGEPKLMIPTLRALVREQDANVVVDSVATMEEGILTGLAQPRLYAMLLGGFATLSLLIAAVGLLGVLSYSVAQRSRELAVRSALGARRADILLLVVKQGLVVTLAGLAIGIPAALALTGSISRLLYGVTRHDPLTFSVVPLLLLAASMLACLPPAIRAARTDPLRLLR